MSGIRPEGGRATVRLKLKRWHPEKHPQKRGQKEQDRPAREHSYGAYPRPLSRVKILRALPRQPSRNPPPRSYSFSSLPGGGASLQKEERSLRERERESERAPNAVAERSARIDSCAVAA